MRCFIDAPGQDEELSYAILMIPTAPLAANTTYLAELVARDAKGGDLSRRWRFTTGAAKESDFSPVDLRPGDLKLVGSVKAVDVKSERLTLSVQEAQAYGSAKRHLKKPVIVTVQLTPSTRFLALDPAFAGKIAFKTGMPLIVIVSNGPLDRPLSARSLLVGR